MRTLALLVIGSIATPAAAFTQVRHLSPAPSALFQAATRGPLHAGAPRETQDSVTRYIQATHWKEGALVGAGVGALGGYGLSRLICEDRESTDSCAGTTALVMLGSAAILAIPGALIGGQFPKD
jgi:hypothetical protein